MTATALEIGHTWDGELLPEDQRATVTLSGHGGALRIEVDAPFAGDPPPSGPAGPTDRLWEHEVVELFVADGTRYTEIEMGPHGHHLVLQLDGVRNAVARALPLALKVSVQGDRWRGTALLHPKWLPASPKTCNAYRIHGVGAARRFHAHAPVPGSEPDFHRLEHFARWPTTVVLD